MSDLFRRMHVIPVGDVDVHAAQETCWCHPVQTSPNVWTHNAADCREVKERLGVESCSEGWILIAEYMQPQPGVVLMQDGVTFSHVEMTGDKARPGICCKCGATVGIQGSTAIHECKSATEPCGACEVYRAESMRQLDRADSLQKLLVAERAAIARFLVPYRRSLPKTWLDHFEQECGVCFDAIGFVYPRPIPIPENLRGGMESPNDPA